MVVERLRDALREPLVGALDVDSPDFSLAHRRVLMSKPMLRELFESFYRDCRALDEKYFAETSGARVEIGSGSSFIADVFPDVITSDIKVLPSVKLVLNAEAMPFPDESLRCIYAINVFHHLPDPRAFFREMLRTLQPGGGIILIEPYYGPAARFLFTRLFVSEGFDQHAQSWETPDAGPFSQANQALSYVVFKRDRSTFEREFPELKLVTDLPHTHLSYLISGGVNFRQLAPDWISPALRYLENALSPLNPVLALQHTIVLRKTLT